jgi:hypothetical protein
LFLLFYGLSASAVVDQDQEPKELTQWGSDQSTYKRREKKLYLRGNAYLVRDGEVLRAEEIDLDLETDLAEARGDVRYQIGTQVIRAEQLNVDLNTKLGVAQRGDLTQGQLNVKGAEFDRISEDRFKIKDFQYSTCIDCPNSWAMSGTYADLTMEGYAFIKDFVLKVNDISLLWLPYLVLPVKTQRQTGLVFPKFGYNQLYGAYYVQPLFIAIDDWIDMTISGGSYAFRGPRVEWEGRYSLTDRSKGVFRFYGIRDRVYNGTGGSRWGSRVELSQGLPSGFNAKLRYFDISDNRYPIDYAGDVPGRLEPVLSSDAFISKNSPELSAALSVRRIRNLLFFDDNGNFNQGFDTNTVQEFPRATVTTNERFLLNTPIATGLEVGFSRFARGGQAFDCGDFGDGPFCTVREANRLSIFPSMYTALSPVPWLSVVPKVTYKGYFYNFDSATSPLDNQVYPSLFRGYLLSQTDISLHTERVFQTSDPNLAYKHTFRPKLTYWNIPVIQESREHPFVSQVQNVARTGQYFDNNDIVPIGASQNLESYFTPQGNSLSYGFVTQLFRRRGEPGQSTGVARLAELSFLQTLDIREATRSLDPQTQDARIPLSPVFANLLVETPHVIVRTEYTYFSYLERYRNVPLVEKPNPNRLSSTLTYVLERGKRNGILAFDRSLSMNYTYSKITSKVSSLGVGATFSINDYFMPRASFSFDLAAQDNQLLDSRYGMLFQSPSQCWRTDLSYIKSIDRGFGLVWTFAFNINGAGFEVFDENRLQQ